MVYKAVQAFFAGKGQSFLPGNSFYPEEDKYASQFDPGSNGHRPVSKPWIKISFNIQFGWPEEDSVRNTSLPPPYFDQAAKTEYGKTIGTSNTPFNDGRQQLHARSQIREPNLATGVYRGRHQATVNKIMGNRYGNCSIYGGVAQLGDIHYHQPAQSRSASRRNPRSQKRRSPGQDRQGSSRSSGD